MNYLGKYTYMSILAVLVIFGIGITTSCSKIDVPPMLEITVIDQDGSPAAGIIVGLFDDQDEWSMLENPVQAWKETDSNGKVSFIDLKEIIYYFYADGDSVNNFGSQIMLSEALKMNEIRQVVLSVK